MFLATLPDYILTSPIAFVAGLMVGFWVGGRFIIRKRRDENGDG